MQNKIMTSPCREIEAPEALSVNREVYSTSRRWKLSISYKTDIFLTIEEKDYFIQQLAKGKKIIRVGEMILTNKFMCIAPVGEVYVKYEDTNEYKLSVDEKEKSIRKLAEIRAKKLFHLII